MFKYTAVIIEPRKHKAFEFVLKNFFENLSDEWGFIIFHGRNNKEYVENILYNNLVQFKNRIDKVIQLDIDNLTSSQYSNICKSSYFYKCIDTEFLLIFQTDTLIINKSIINDFLKYDYVGAPWMNKMVGNGGLSLRRKSKMIEITEKVNPAFTDHEDNYFCYQPFVNLNRPSFEEAQRFSVETIFYEKSFGVHSCWKFLNKYELGFLIERYPELSTLIELNK